MIFLQYCISYYVNVSGQKVFLLSVLSFALAVTLSILEWMCTSLSSFWKRCLGESTWYCTKIPPKVLGHQKGNKRSLWPKRPGSTSHSKGHLWLWCRLFLFLFSFTPGFGWRRMETRTLSDARLCSRKVCIFGMYLNLCSIYFYIYVFLFSKQTKFIRE